MKINKLIKHAFAVTLIAFAFLTLPKVANAANYYVSLSGSDSNSGTLSSPFKTIQKGTNTVNAGNGKVDGEDFVVWLVNFGS